MDIVSEEGFLIAVFLATNTDLKVGFVHLFMILDIRKNPHQVVCFVFMHLQFNFLTVGCR